MPLVTTTEAGVPIQGPSATLIYDDWYPALRTATLRNGKLATAMLLGIPPPSLVAFADALPTMSPMARSFWAENRCVANAKTKAALGIAWRYPTYREGLRAILTQQPGDRLE